MLSLSLMEKLIQFTKTKIIVSDSSTLDTFHISFVLNINGLFLSDRKTLPSAVVSPRIVFLLFPSDLKSYMMATKD